MSNTVVSAGLGNLAAGSRIEIHESAPEALEVFLYPTGWKRAYTWKFAIVTGVMLLVLAGPVHLWWRYPGVFDSVVAIANACIFCVWLAAVLHQFLNFYRLAEEWTLIRVERGQVKIQRPRFWRDDEVSEHPLQGVKKVPRERYAEIHRIAFEIGEREVCCFTPLEYEDARWLIDEINRRIAAPEVDDAGPS